MASITVKNIPPEIYEKLKQAAKMSHRSLNREIIACLERAVSSQPLNPDLLLVNAHTLREKTASYRITDDEFNVAKNTGRS